MPKKDSRFIEAKENLLQNLSLFFSKAVSINNFLSHNHVLQQRYGYAPKTDGFFCKNNKTFIDFIAKNPEKKFYELLQREYPSKNTITMLSESDLVEIYLVYCWAFDYAHEHKLGTDWQKDFMAQMHLHTCEKNRQDLQNLIEKQKTKWPKTKVKMYSDIFKKIETIPSAEQRSRYCFQMLEQKDMKHFYSNNDPHHVFSHFSEQVSRYEYETLTQELNEALQPILYYPQTDLQQSNICNFAKHCLFIDKDTKELKYINSRGTLFKLDNHLLLNKKAEQVRAHNGNWHLEYKKSEKSRETQDVVVEKKHSDDFGVAFRLNEKILSKLVPTGFPKDPIIKLAGKTLKSIQNHHYSVQKTLSLFGQDHVVAYQEKMAGLVQIKEMLEGVTTREIVRSTAPPNAQDYLGRGRNTYVFFDKGLFNRQSELWHIDRSHDFPVLTQFPLDIYHGEKLHFMFNGAQSGQRPRAGVNDVENCNKWYELGQSAQNMKNNTVLRLNPDAARNIPDLVLKELDIYQHLLVDRTYYEASNELTDVLENAEPTPENMRLIQRCRDIHRHLYLIEQDRLHAFPKSRGVVPPHLRQKMMQMMTALVLDKNSPEARHYFRSDHRVYRGDLQDDQFENYEPGSFVWNGEDTLYYLDENKKKTEVTMTDSIRRKLTKIMENPEETHQIISANDVYELMTRPRLFYYYRGFPVCLDLRWFNFSYYIPLSFDRSKGLHTGTAQEMTREIHEQKLSVMQLLYKLGEVIILLVVPVILAHFGIDIPWHMLGELAATIIGWVFLIWNIEYTFNYLRFSLSRNDLAQPELNELDKLLHELDADVKNLPDLARLDTSSEEDDYFEEDDLLSGSPAY